MRTLAVDLIEQNRGRLYQDHDLSREGSLKQPREFLPRKII